MAAITFDTDFDDDSLFTFPGTEAELFEAVAADIAKALAEAEAASASELESDDANG